MYICPVANSFSKQIHYNKKPLLAVIVPHFKKDGMHFEVNINGFPRFFMSWSPLGRYDISEGEPKLPDELVLAVSDVIEQNTSRKK